MNSVSVKQLQLELINASIEQIDTLERKMGKKVSPSGKKYVRQIVSRVVSEDSPDIHRIGRVSRVRINDTTLNRFKSRKRNQVKRSRVIVEAPDNIQDIVTSSVKKVLINASKVSSGSHIGVTQIDAAIKQNWCNCYPFCARVTGRKLGMTVTNKKLSSYE